MWEWNYGKEPFDMKLLVLRLIKKIWLPIFAALLGAIIVGGSYFLAREVFGEPDEYQITSSYYVEYGTDPQTDQAYTYINYATWNSWITTDWFVDRIWDEAMAGGLKPEAYGIVKTDLPGFLFADLPSDLRMPISVVTTENPELTEHLAEAVEKVFLLFAEEQKEIVSIRVVDTTDVALVDQDIRTLRACILGAVLAVFFCLTGMLLYFITDDAIYLPEQFSCRYGIPAVGAICGCGEKAKLLEGTAENVAYKVRGCNVVALTSVEEETDLKAAAALLTGEGYVCIPSVALVPEAAEKIREADGVLLLVQAGVPNGKKIAHVLHELQVQDCKVDGVILVDADEKLIQAYRMTGYRGKKG